MKCTECELVGIELFDLNVNTYADFNEMIRKSRKRAYDNFFYNLYYTGLRPDSPKNIIYDILYDNGDIQYFMKKNRLEMKDFIEFYNSRLPEYLATIRDKKLTSILE